MRKGDVYINDALCGHIVEDENDFCFWYRKEWLDNPDAEPVSLTLPLREEPYKSNILFPFFDGLIPEGYLLRIATVKLGIGIKDRMGLLLKTCQDAIGCVSVKEANGDE